MYERELQSVLRCAHCNKPFDKQSTLKRHGYYCRSRKADSTPRSRSCVSCVKGKARCDNKQPACSRCTSKAIGCHYPPSTAKSTGSKPQSGDKALSGWGTSTLQDPPKVNGHQNASSDVDPILDSALAAMPNHEFGNVEENYFDWDVSNLDFTDLLAPKTNNKSFQPSSPDWASFLRPSADQTVQIQSPLSPNIWIPKQPTYSQRSLIHRPKRQTGQQRIANLIWHTLKSYLVMLQQQDTLPPFLHAQSITSQTEDKDMESLTNCISLMRMIGSDAQKSRKLFWRNVRMECERLCAEYLTLNKWELLAAMQALSIYILFRVNEGETEDNNFDSLLIAAVTLTARQAANEVMHSMQSVTPYDYSVEGSWKSWIFAESVRRLCIIYQIINMLVYFEPAYMCEFPADLVLAPLPAKKSLWEATDEMTWKVESEKEPGVKTAFGLVASGELVKLEDRGIYYGENAVVGHEYLIVRGGTGWEEWCAGMDGLGGLVLLAAALVG